MEANISTSVSTVCSLHHLMADCSRDYSQPSSASVSQPSSPHSSSLPSPPDSPSSDSSSLPSVSSSYFFSSSAAASPKPSRAHSEHGRDLTQGLIIPSLTLPDALRRPTPYGQTMGDVRLLVLGSQGAGKSFLTGLLLEDNEHVVDIGTWEDAPYGKVLYASTDWVEHRDAHGLEKFEPTRNVEFLELPGYDHKAERQELITTLKSIIHEPFTTVADVLHPHNQPSAVVANLLASSCTPLYTALIFLLPSAPSSLDSLIIDSLGPHIPIIVLPSHHAPSRLDSSTPKLSSFRPESPVALRSGLFHSPESLALLRSEAADRFLRWREVERAANDIYASRKVQRAEGREGMGWDKAKWEADYLSSLSQDVARRVREGTITQRNFVPSPAASKRSTSDEKEEVDAHHDLPQSPVRDESCIGHSFDPLHFPSLLVFSASLLGCLRFRLRRSIAEFFDGLGEANVRVALFGGFCIGLGIGLYVR